MKHFLFLYPTRNYTQQIGTNFPNRHLLLENFSRNVNRLIQERYRKQAFQICWLFFAQNHNRKLPDTEKSDPLFEILPEDWKISSGITQRELFQCCYPSADQILDHFKESTQLVLGGFHLYDCVERIARRAHRKSMPVSVDEDLTDDFAFRVNHFGPIPLQRNIRIYPETLSELRKRLPEEKVQTFLKASQQKPWLSQIQE